MTFTGRDGWDQDGRKTGVLVENVPSPCLAVEIIGKGLHVISTAKIHSL